MLTLRNLALAVIIIGCIYKGPHHQQYLSTQGSWQSQGSQVQTSPQHVMFIANNSAARLRQPLPTLLYIIDLKETFQHIYLICVHNRRLWF